MKAEDLTTGTVFRNQQGERFIVRYVVAVANDKLCRVHYRTKDGRVHSMVCARTQLFETLGHRDNYGRLWPSVPENERCAQCGQPDNCGDCTHEQLTDDEVLELGGEL